MDSMMMESIQGRVIDGSTGSSPESMDSMMMECIPGWGIDGSTGSSPEGFFRSSSSADYMMIESIQGWGIDGSTGSSPDGFFRSSSFAWVEGMKEAQAQGDYTPMHPPDYLVLYPDLVGEGWGWERLVPCRVNDGCVEWPHIKRYLVSYFENNEKKVDQLVGKRKPDPVGQPDKVAAKDDALLAAVNQCIEAECKLVRTCHEELTLNDILLSRDIRERAKHLLQSGCQSSAAAAALLCITKEAELICDLFTLAKVTTSESSFANVIRRSALNFMLFEDSESDAAAAAAGIMLGLARETEEAMLALNSNDQFATVNYFNAVDARQRVVSVLTKLEEELIICKTADAAGDGTLTGVLKSKGSHSMESCNENMTKHTRIKSTLETGYEADKGGHKNKELGPTLLLNKDDQGSGTLYTL